MQNAILDEIKYYNRLVWETATPEQAQLDQDSTIVGGRFGMCTKCESENPRSALPVRCDRINRDGEATAAFYAATPPLEAIRLLCSQFAHQRRRGRDKLKLSFIDVTKAYFNATPKRSLYVRVPKEMGMAPGTFGKICDMRVWDARRKSIAGGYLRCYSYRRRIYPWKCLPRMFLSPHQKDQRRLPRR